MYHYICGCDAHFVIVTQFSSVVSVSVLVSRKRSCGVAEPPQHYLRGSPCNILAGCAVPAYLLFSKHAELLLRPTCLCVGDDCLFFKQFRASHLRCNLKYRYNDICNLIIANPKRQPEQMSQLRLMTHTMLQVKRVLTYLLFFHLLS